MTVSRHAFLILYGLVATTHATRAQDAACGGERDGVFDEIATERVGDGVLFRTPKLAVDADGAPDSYRLDGEGLSGTCDGVVGIVNGRRVTPTSDKDHWQAICERHWTNARWTGDYSSVSIFGFETDDRGVPIVQRKGDPLPDEAYVSTTSVTVPGARERTQSRYVDAVKIPYVVLPAPFRERYSVGPGDLAVVYWPAKGKIAFGVYGDQGGLGEASVRLHRELGNEPVVVVGGVRRARADISDAVVTVVFPGVCPRRQTNDEAWRDDIVRQGTRQLAAWGGEARLKACAR